MISTEWIPRRHTEQSTEHKQSLLPNDIGHSQGWEWMKATETVVEKYTIKGWERPMGPLYWPTCLGRLHMIEKVRIIESFPGTYFSVLLRLGDRTVVFLLCLLENLWWENNFYYLWPSLNCHSIPNPAPTPPSPCETWHSVSVPILWGRGSCPMTLKTAIFCSF